MYENARKRDLFSACERKSEPYFMEIGYIRLTYKHAD